MYLQQGIMCLLLILMYHGNDNFMGVTDFTDIDLFPQTYLFV